MFYRYLLFGIFLFAGGLPMHGQEPAAVGKPYAAEAKRPVSPAQQFPSPVRFTDATASSRINFRHEASPTAQKYLLETMGAGVAVFDIDNDNRLDILLTNGARLLDPMPAGGWPDKTEPRYWNRLYRQNANGTFDDVTEKAGVKGVGYGFGTAVGDVDGNGFDDLFVTHFGGAVLYRNNGDGTFTDITEKSGIRVSAWPASAGFLDYDKDGRLDLFVTRYVEWDFRKGALVCGDARPGYRSYCHPDNFPPTTSLLFRQKADGTFEDVSDRAGISKHKGKALGVAFADLDDDGWTDIFVANDNTEQQLYRNKGNGTFENVALLAGVAFDENGRDFAGMGVDIADFNRDGHQDIIVTAFSGETYPLFQNLGDGGFNSVTQRSGVGQITSMGTGWGVKFADADNDGLRDILLVQGHVSDVIEKSTDFLSYKQPTLLMHNAGQSFRNISHSSGEFFKTDLAARGMATGDLDNDGDVDAVIAQTDGPAVLLRNDGPKSEKRNAWIGLELIAKNSAPGGVGARVTVTDSSGGSQVFDVSGSGSYLASNDRRVLVGLGRNTAARVRVKWPSGKTQTLENAEPGRYHQVKER